MKTHPYDNADFVVSFYDTFPEFLTGIDREYGPRPALSWFTRKQEQHTLTYHELTRQVFSLRRALLSRGLIPGSHVAIVSENSANWIICFLAIACCGCVAVCVDIEQSDDSIRDMIRRADANIVFCSQTFLPICSPLLEDCANISHVVLMEEGPGRPLVTPVAELYELGASLPESTLPLCVSSDQAVELVFTSGTTSQSKMVLLSQGAVMQNLCDSSSYIHFFQSIFCSLPFYHTYGLNCAVLGAFLRGTHLYMNGNLKTTMRDLKLAGPDTILTVPLMVEVLHNQLWLSAEQAGKADELRRALKLGVIFKKLHLPRSGKLLPQLKQALVGNLRLIICGGAHLSQAILEEFDLLGIQMLQGYGITECAPLISVNCNYDNKIGSVGRPLPSCQIKLHQGEILVKSPHIMQGYYKDPAQTAAVLKDGWFFTGDLGHLDKDEFLYITGRKKNLIVFKNGKKVSPEKLEELISAIPMVKEVVISGTLNGELADEVKLTASIFPDSRWTEGLSSYEILECLQQNINKINQTLPAYEQVQLVNIREKEFHKTASKKIKRHAN